MDFLARVAGGWVVGVEGVSGSGEDRAAEGWGSGCWPSQLVGVCGGCGGRLGEGVGGDGRTFPHSK